MVYRDHFRAELRNERAGGGGGRLDGLDGRRDTPTERGGYCDGGSTEQLEVVQRYQNRLYVDINDLDINDVLLSHSHILSFKNTSSD